MARRVEIRGLPDVYALLAPEIAKKARRATVNEITKQSKTATSKKIRVRYTIKAKALTKRMRVKTLNPSGSGGEAKITVKGRGFALTEFTGTRQTARGVSVKLKKDSSRQIIRHAFLTTLGSGHKGAFQRRWRRTHRTAPLGTMTRGFARLPRRYRLPMDELLSVGAPDMFDHADVYDEVQTLADQKAERIFRQKFSFYAERA